MILIVGIFLYLIKFFDSIFNVCPAGGRADQRVRGRVLAHLQDDEDPARGPLRCAPRRPQEGAHRDPVRGHVN